MPSPVLTVVTQDTHGSNPQKDLPAVHPIQDEPVNQQYGRAQEKGLIGVTGELEEVLAQMGS